MGICPTMLRSVHLQVDQSRAKGLRSLKSSKHNQRPIDDNPDSRSHCEDGGESSSRSNEAEGGGMTASGPLEAAKLTPLVP